jgi:hypothetical protein
MNNLVQNIARISRPAFVESRGLAAFVVPEAASRVTVYECRKCLSKHERVVAPAGQS